MKFKLGDLVRLTSPYAVQAFCGKGPNHSPYAIAIRERITRDGIPILVVQREFRSAVDEFYVSFWELVENTFENGDGI